MTTTIALQTIVSGSTHPKAIKAAQEFPAKLFAVHGDNIRIRDTAVYFGTGTSKGSKGKGIDVSCSVCGHEWSPRVNNLLRGAGCPQCALKRQAEMIVASAGERRCPPTTPEEKSRAVELRAAGMSFDAVRQQLFDEGLSPQLRSIGTIYLWANPEKAEENRQRAATRYQDPVKREQSKATMRRYISEFNHGRAGARARSANYRLLKQNTPEVVFLDGEWHEVDRKETYRVFGEVLLPASERKLIQELYLEAQYQTETTGVEHHVDHIQPLSKGGEHLMYNLQILPAEENLSKNDTFREEDQTELCRRLFTHTNN
jgi:5-methylcytosine-specific restriction endonuclease McrA